ncbi:twin-arginine translocation signal domain-containing protein [Pseudomonas syringae]|nr:twin-arginine translocation signal domain-containing protein [Pseudomonas syringae]
MELQFKHRRSFLKKLAVTIVLLSLS